MPQNHHAVSRLLHIDLHKIGHILHGQFHRRHGILRCRFRAATVRGNLNLRQDIVCNGGTISHKVEEKEEAERCRHSHARSQYPPAE